MSISFDVKMVEGVNLGRVRAEVGLVFGEIFSEEVLVRAAAADHLVLGESEAEFECYIDENVTVTMMVHKAGEERELGLEGGYWLSVTVDRVRSGNSAVLALMLAAAAARVIGTDVVDDWGVLEAGRSVPPDLVVDLVRRMAVGGGFALAAQAFAARIGLEYTPAS